MDLDVFRLRVMTINIDGGFIPGEDNLLSFWQCEVLFNG
jgi:hypothetical protein